jgi:hypothetical protein
MIGRRNWYTRSNPGEAMAKVAFYVHNHPGEAMYHAARYAAPGPSHRPGVGYGYASVHRAIKHGLVIGKSGPRGSTLLYPV